MSRPWYATIDRTQWRTLGASNLGWMFDGYETFALVLTVGTALHQLLAPELHARIPAYAGTVIGLTLLGWGIGGLAGGVLADYVGRKRMMLWAILAYSLMTGLSAFAWDWTSFLVLRFLVGIAIGSEWVTGSSITAETWPDHARGKGAGLMQCGLAVGFFLASFIWLVVAPLGEDAWRAMYLLGVLPALLVLWIRRGIPESARWQAAAAARRAARARHAAGAALVAEETVLVRFTLADLFADPVLRRRSLVTFTMSLATTLAWWGISTWVPPFIAQRAAAAGQAGPQWASYAGMAYTAGSIVGYAAFGFLADAWGRRRVTALYMALAFVLTPVLFLWAQSLPVLLAAAFVNAIFSNGQYSWMPVWLPELFPTRLRATAMAFAFNGPRFVAFLGPMLAGQLIVASGGHAQAALLLSTIYLAGFAALWLLPETAGRPLPA